MNDKMFELISDIDCICVQLDELDMALDFLDDEMYRGRQSEEGFVDWKAKNFVLRIPRCQALLHTIRYELQARTKELDAAMTALLELTAEETVE